MERTSTNCAKRQNPPKRKNGPNRGKYNCPQYKATFGNWSQCYKHIQCSLPCKCNFMGKPDLLPCRKDSGGDACRVTGSGLLLLLLLLLMLVLLRLGKTRAQLYLLVLKRTNLPLGPGVGLKVSP